MKVSELIKRLHELNPDMEVTIIDGFNGGGQPRTINYGPKVSVPEENKHCSDRLNYDDVETPIGQAIVVIGFGCY